MNLTVIAALVIGFMGIKVHAFDTSNAFSESLLIGEEYEAQYQVMKKEISSLKEALQSLEEQFRHFAHKASAYKGEYHYQLQQCVKAVKESQEQ